MLGHSNLENYYQTQFSLVQHHKYTLTELENMIPYELDIYINLLVEHMKKLERERNER
jgi:hypothetical protein